jgi:hypothetical protein
MERNRNNINQGVDGLTESYGSLITVGAAQESKA